MDAVEKVPSQSRNRINFHPVEVRGRFERNARVDEPFLTATSTPTASGNMLDTQTNQSPNVSLDSQIKRTSEVLFNTLEADAIQSLASMATRFKSYSVSFGTTSIMIDPRQAASILLEYGPEPGVPREYPCLAYRSSTEELLVLFRMWNPNFKDHFYFEEDTMKWVPKLGHVQTKKARKKSSSRRCNNASKRRRQNCNAESSL